MKFTQEEISLCKKIAERHRRFPHKGDWEYNDNTKEPTLRTEKYLGMENPLFIDGANIFLIWQIHDCLEFLRKRKYRIAQCYDGYGIIRKDKSPDVTVVKLWNWEKDLLPEVEGTGNTLLEALLKAVLAILEAEEKPGEVGR